MFYTLYILSHLVLTAKPLGFPHFIATDPGSKACSNHTFLELPPFMTLTTVNRGISLTALFFISLIGLTLICTELKIQFYYLFAVIWTDYFVCVCFPIYKMGITTVLS